MDNFTVLERIKGCFTESIQTQIAAAEALPDAISRAAMTLVQSLLNGNKILCCGNGTSAANAQHFCRQHDQPLRNRASKFTGDCTKCR